MMVPRRGVPRYPGVWENSNARGNPSHCNKSFSPETGIDNLPVNSPHLKNWDALKLKHLGDLLQHPGLAEEIYGSVMKMNDVMTR